MKCKLFSGFHLFGKAYQATKHEIGVSMKLLIIITLVFAVVLYVAENSVNGDYSFWDALVWTFVKYVDDPADIAAGPETPVGKVVGTLVGVLGIAIFAVPAGLIGSGLMDAMSDEKHEKEIEEYKGRMKKTFRRAGNKSLRSYLNTLPEKGGAAFSKLNFVPQFVPLSRLQIRLGIGMKEVCEICERYPEFSLKNMADACSDEENVDDRYVLGLSPINTSYGCCVDRGSNVTIVSPCGFSEVSTGWFAYYLAKMGGFNFVGKSIEVDPDEVDSFYNMSAEPLYDKKKKSEFSAKEKDILEILDRKTLLRDDFLNDIKKIAAKGSWVIVVAEHVMNSDNKTDFHFADNIKDGSQPAVVDTERYEALYKAFDDAMQGEFALSSTEQSARYPLLKSNIVYRLRKEGVDTNAFVLRPSSHLINFDTKKLTVAFRMAQVISESLDAGKGMSENDIKDFSTTGFGFSESVI